MMESLAYEMHEGKGPPVLLVHGAMGTRLAWGLNIDAFRKVASPVVVELWGHGRSPVPSGISAYLVAEYVAQFEKMRRDMGVKTWLTIGVSTGGSLALQYVREVLGNHHSRSGHEGPFRRTMHAVVVD